LIREYDRQPYTLDPGGSVSARAGGRTTEITEITEQNQVLSLGALGVLGG